MKKQSPSSKIGIFIVVLGFISPVFGLVIPFLGLDTTTTAALVTAFMVGGPEILIVLGGLLAGKEGVLLVKNKVKKLFGLPEGKYPATRSQYTVGVILLMLWFTVTVFTGYIPGFYEIPFVRDNIIWLCIGADVVFLIAIFGFGGHQMITKFSRLLKWEPWELPEKS